mgnify:CR=1 FL=1
MPFSPRTGSGPFVEGKPPSKASAIGHAIPLRSALQRKTQQEAKNAKKKMKQKNGIPSDRRRPPRRGSIDRPRLEAADHLKGVYVHRQGYYNDKQAEQISRLRRCRADLFEPAPPQLQADRAN